MCCELNMLFDVKLLLRECYLMFLWLFNLYMDAVAKETNVMTFGRGTQIVKKKMKRNDRQVSCWLMIQR